MLAERGVVLSASQVHRLVTSKPERLSLTILAALCDVFTLDPSELIVTEATSVGVCKAAAGDRPALPANLDQVAAHPPGSRRTRDRPRTR